MVAGAVVKVCINSLTRPQTAALKQPPSIYLSISFKPLFVYLSHLPFAALRRMLTHSITHCHPSSPRTSATPPRNKPRISKTNPTPTAKSAPHRHAATIHTNPIPTSHFSTPQLTPTYHHYHHHHHHRNQLSHPQTSSQHHTK
ncbi:uncharacterized protein K452DRAFT_63930 [Aplosporella prunicola CBS 121167]|uniref:Uncharacterized protein n=1 Tax=Aplosporella prunicola CBS 121167 TaxID=1176127 RepID=A0A6A6B8Z3_9PEZI|nr:uncharacterized protein K452DRAFT_63930 [Aplosporella prunicola CBS 121167]KAF2139674.1 hypothetical protein K452DRAFT_63930 [Aplosporella prunicola CBS 121167]